ncbi:MAG TPA: mechanosensitive ion channel domain-containing protein [Myxococcota bacterium]|nr:mechanosensitive ion channel domain-containing protein [Myxococcota bacterium]
MALNKAASLLPHSPEIVQIEQQLPGIEEALRQRYQLLGRALAVGGNRARLTDAAADWARTLAQLEAWSQTVALRVQRIESSIDSLAAERETWNRTRVDAASSDAPQSIATRIEATLGAIDAALRTAGERRSLLLTLQDRIVQQDLFASAALDEIRAAEREGRHDLLQKDAPAWWRDLREIRPGAHADDVRLSVAEDLSTLRAYLAVSRSRFLVDLLLFVAIARYAFAVRRRLAHPIDGVPPIGESGRRLFERPIAIAVLAGLLVARLIHRDAPIGFATIVSLLMLVPLVRLVPLLLPPSVRWVPWWMAALVLLSRVRRIVYEAPLAETALFGLESLGMIGALLWLMRPARLAVREARVPAPQLLRAGMRATLFLLVTALGASALGYRSLAMLLGTATLASVYAATILYAAACAARAAIEASFHTSPARRFAVVRDRRDSVLRVTGACVSLAAMIYWGYLTLSFFEVIEPVRDAAELVLGSELNLGELEISVGDVLAFGLIVALAFALSRLIRFFLEEEIFPRMRLRRGVGNAVATLFQYATLLVGLALAFSAAGMEFSRLALFAGAFGVGLGFGLQTVINNFVSGLILLFERPIQVGDMVEVGGLLGEVRRIGARSCTVRTADGAEVIVPNANLISEQVVNWTRSDRRRRITVDVGVAYGTDPVRVLELLRGVGAASPAVLGDPPPEALFLGFGESALNFRLRAWIPRFEESYGVSSDLGVAISAALRDAGIEIPFPQRDLRVRSIEPDALRALDATPRT